MFAKKAIFRYLSQVEVASVKPSASLIRFCWYDTSFCFINCLLENSKDGQLSKKAAILEQIQHRGFMEDPKT